jgi:nucleoside 2-deoxyribosyltransferase
MGQQSKPRRIYLASSWRNPTQPAVLAALRNAGHEVYDFRNPAPGQKGFAWSDCETGGGAKTIPSYLEAIRSTRAAESFALDKEALDWCNTCVLALPCGRSAHLELGYATGQGKDTYVLLHEHQFEPELMYLLNTGICANTQELIDLLK